MTSTDRLSRPTSANLCLAALFLAIVPQTRATTALQIYVVEVEGGNATLFVSAPTSRS